ncbi:hypothetical protein [Ruania albidiflava]|uniref:hypothetical protein n=1 Tax=Ruania albidiflava TaxID=366586 RepID=UPI0003B6DC50|nr:hypothetical protein [Ruania albidiflava]
MGEDAYSDQQQMFDLMHEMRTRIITGPACDWDRVLGTILFGDTLDREIEEVRTVKHLWTASGIVPLPKIDRGQTAE